MASSLARKHAKKSSRSANQKFDRKVDAHVHVHHTEKFSEEDLVLSTELFPLSAYVSKRSGLLGHAFRALGDEQCSQMLPTILKEMPQDKLKEYCLREIGVMSKKRLLRLIDGYDNEVISSSESEESEPEEDDKSAERVDQEQDVVNETVPAEEEEDVPEPESPRWRSPTPDDRSSPGSSRSSQSNHADPDSTTPCNIPPDAHETKTDGEFEEMIVMDEVTSQGASPPISDAEAEEDDPVQHETADGDDTKKTRSKFALEPKPEGFNRRGVTTTDSIHTTKNAMKKYQKDPNEDKTWRWQHDDREAPTELSDRDAPDDTGRPSRVQVEDDDDIPAMAWKTGVSKRNRLDNLEEGEVMEGPSGEIIATGKRPLRRIGVVDNSPPRRAPVVYNTMIGADEPAAVDDGTTGGTFGPRSPGAPGPFAPHSPGATAGPFAPRSPGEKDTGADNTAETASSSESETEVDMDDSFWLGADSINKDHESSMCLRTLKQVDPESVVARIREPRSPDRSPDDNEDAMEDEGPADENICPPGMEVPVKDSESDCQVVEEDAVQEQQVDPSLVAGSKSAQDARMKSLTSQLKQDKEGLPEKPTHSRFYGAEARPTKSSKKPAPVFDRPRDQPEQVQQVGSTTDAQVEKMKEKVKKAAKQPLLTEAFLAQLEDRQKSIALEKKERLKRIEQLRRLRNSFADRQREVVDKHSLNLFDELGESPDKKSRAKSKSPLRRSSDSDSGSTKSGSSKSSESGELSASDRGSSRSKSPSPAAKPAPAAPRVRPPAPVERERRKTYLEKPRLISDFVEPTEPLRGPSAMRRIIDQAVPPTSLIRPSVEPSSKRRRMADAFGVPERSPSPEYVRTYGNIVKDNRRRQPVTNRLSDRRGRGHSSYRPAQSDYRDYGRDDRTNRGNDYDDRRSNFRNIYSDGYEVEGRNIARPTGNYNRRRERVEGRYGGDRDEGRYGGDRDDGRYGGDRDREVGDAGRGANREPVRLERFYRDRNNSPYDNPHRQQQNLRPEDKFRPAPPTDRKGGGGSSSDDDDDYKNYAGASKWEKMENRDRLQTERKHARITAPVKSRSPISRSPERAPKVTKGRASQKPPVDAAPLKITIGEEEREVYELEARAKAIKSLMRKRE